MKGPKIAIIATISLVVFLFTFMFCFRFVNIKPTQAGVKIIKLGGKPRVVSEPLGVGIKFYNPITTDVVLYKIATRSYPGDLLQRKRGGNAAVLGFKTSDGQNVKCDLTIQFALIKKEVPLLHEEVGENYESEILMPKVRSISRIILGGYSAEELYQGSVRDAIQERLTVRLGKELKIYHILVKSSLIRDFNFSQQFEKKIEEKKLASQQVEINRNKALAQEEEAKRQEAEARGNKLMAIQTAEGKAESMKIEADAERYKLEQEAAGDLARYKADAEGKRLQAEALGGGANVVALEFAKRIPDKLKIYGFPVGKQSTSIMDVSGMFKGMLSGKE